MANLYSSEKDSTAIVRGAGPGLTSGWTCQACAKPKFSMLGRKKRRVRGMSTWVCAECAALIDGKGGK